MAKIIKFLRKSEESKFKKEESGVSVIVEYILLLGILALLMFFIVPQLNTMIGKLPTVNAMRNQFQDVAGEISAEITDMLLIKPSNGVIKAKVYMPVEVGKHSYSVAVNNNQLEVKSNVWTQKTNIGNTTLGYTARGKTVSTQQNHEIELNVTHKVLPTAVAIAYPNVVLVGQKVTFDMTHSFGTGIIKYKWFFGDGNNTTWITYTNLSTGIVHYTYTKAGNYTATLEVRDCFGVSNDSVNIVVLPTPENNLSVKKFVSPDYITPGGKAKIGIMLFGNGLAQKQINLTVVHVIDTSGSMRDLTPFEYFNDVGYQKANSITVNVSFSSYLLFVNTSDFESFYSKYGFYPINVYVYKDGSYVKVNIGDFEGHEGYYMILPPSTESCYLKIVNLSIFNEYANIYVYSIKNTSTGQKTTEILSKSIHLTSNEYEQDFSGFVKIDAQISPTIQNSTYLWGYDVNLGKYKVSKSKLSINTSSNCPLYIIPDMFPGYYEYYTLHVTGYTSSGSVTENRYGFLYQDYDQVTITINNGEPAMGLLITTSDFNSFSSKYGVFPIRAYINLSGSYAPLYYATTINGVEGFIYTVTRNKNVSIVVEDLNPFNDENVEIYEYFGYKIGSVFIPEHLVDIYTLVAPKTSKIYEANLPYYFEKVELEFLTDHSNNFYVWLYNNVTGYYQVYGPTAEIHEDLSPNDNGNYSYTIYVVPELTPFTSASYTLTIETRKIDAAKYGAITFDSYLRKYDFIGLVNFSDYGAQYLVNPPTNVTSVVNSKILELTPYGWTPMAAGLEYAINELKSFDNRYNKPAVDAMVLLTDGLPNVDLNGVVDVKNATRDVIHEAEIAKSYGYIIYTIGYGSQGDINASLLEEIAEMTGGKYYYAANAQELKEIYVAIAKDLRTKVAKDVVITDVIPPDVKVLNASGNYTIIQTSKGTAVQWRIPVFRINQSWVGSITITTTKVGTIEVDVPKVSNITYIPINNTNALLPQKTIYLPSRELNVTTKKTQGFILK